MEKEFIPYDLAVKLNALGFEEKCFCNWEDSWSPEPEDEIRMVLTTDQTWLRPGWVRAPTFSQAFRWFREKHGLHYEIHHVPSIGKKLKYTPKYVNESSEYTYEVDGSLIDVVGTYEEAELACLTELIEIIEELKKSE